MDHDAASRLTELVQNLAGTTSDLTLGFSYNPASQITQNTRSNDNFAFTGHVNLNRTDTINGLNQVTATGGTTVTHDARGNVNGIGSASYGYTAENLLATGPGATLAYDGLGRLYYRGTTGEWQDYAGGALIAEVSVPSNTITRRFVHGPGMDEPLVWYEGSGTSDRRWFHADERGSVIAVSDGSGNLIGARNRYDEYGVPQGSLTGRFGYTGQVWLPEAGLYYYRARIYNPSLGRFMQTDPIGYRSGMNFYAYVRADPVNFTDPLGLAYPDITVVGNRPRPQDWFNAALNYIDLNNLLSQLTGTSNTREPGPELDEKTPDCDSPGADPYNCSPVVTARRIRRLPFLPLTTSALSISTDVCQLPPLLAADQFANDNNRTAHYLCRALTYSCLQNASGGGRPAAACRTAGRLCDLAVLASAMSPRLGTTQVEFPDGAILEVNRGVAHIVRTGHRF